MPTSIAILPAPPIAVPGVGPGGDLFIFRPLEPAPTGNVFASWIALVAAASVVVGSKRVYFDDSLAPCVIPAGIWDFASPTDFFGDDGQPLVTPTPLAIDDGAVLRNVFGFRSLAITSATTTAVISAPLGGADYYFSGSCRVTQANPAGNFLLAAVGFVFSPVTVTLLEYAEFVTGAAGPASGQVVMVGGVGSQASVVALDHSNVQTNTIGSLGGSAVGSTVDSASIATAQVGMAPIPVGVLTVTLLSAAVREFYDDALVPPLLGVADVQAAIDALKGTIVTGTPFEYVFRPGGVASGNVFTSWLALVAAAATFPGQKLVYFDDTLGPCIIPAGVHNFGTGPAAFTGKPGAGSLTTPLQIVDGAFLLGVVEFSWLLIDSQTTTFCIDAPAGVTTIYIADHVTMITQSGVGGVFIRSTGAGTGAVLSLLQGSNLVSGIALSALAAASITVAVVDGSAVAANTLSAALGTTALGIIVDATGTISAVQPAVLVPFPILLVAQAAKTFYDDTLVPPLLGVAEVQAAIDALKGTIATGTPYEYVFRPGGVASGNVYTVWATLVASAATFPGAKLVYFDDTFGPCSIPIGVWDFASPTTFVGDVGRSTISPTSLTFDDGAELRNVYEFRSLNITSFTTTQVITAPLGGKNYSFSGTCRVTQTDPAGNFLLSAVGFVFSPTVVTLLEAAEFVTGPGASPLGGQVVMVGGVGSQAAVYALDRSNVQRDTIGSLGGSAAGYVVDSATLSTAQVGMNPVPIGVLTVYVLGTPYEYVFQPGGVARGNVYTSWAALVEVAAIFPGEKVVYFDDTFGPCVIPAGPLTWDFVSPTTFRGNPSVATPVTVADGATLSNVFGFDSVAIDSLSTTFVIDQPALPLTAEYTLSGGATIRQMGLAGTFIRGNFVGTTSTILLKDRARLLTGAGVPGATAVLSVTNAGSLFGVLTLGSSAVEANTLATIGPLPNGTLGDPNSSIATAQFGVPGAVLPIVLTSLAANVDYDDALVLPPLGAVEVQTAIDALKGRSLASRSFSGTLLSDALLLAVTGYFGDVPNTAFLSTIGYPADATSQNVTLVVNVTANNVLTTTRFEIYKNNVPTGIFLDYLTTVTGITSITAALVLTAGVDAVDLVATNTTGGAGNQIAASASVRYNA